MSLTVLAPAKLNLFLHVLGRRDDGYHRLQTLFQLIDLCDEVQLQVTDDGLISRDPPPADPVLAALPDADDLTLGQARRLGAADRLWLEGDVPDTVMALARRDAPRDRNPTDDAVQAWLAAGEVICRLRAIRG